MPTSLISSSGVSFHLFQLPSESAPEPDDQIEYTVLENEMSEGYREAALFGLDTGVKSFKLSFPTLAGASVPVPTATDPDAAAVTREQYVRNVFKKNKTTGLPFAYTDPNNGRFYLVDIINDKLTFQKTKNVNIYSTSLDLKQRRINNITLIDEQTWTYGFNYEDTEYDSFGDITATTQNSEAVIRFNATANTGYITKSPIIGAQRLTFYDIFLVMKVRETTFSNNAGIFTSKTALEEQVLLGSSGTTKFQNLALSNMEYRLNGVLYTQANQQAPMDAWGVVHLRFKGGKSLSSGWQIGRDRETAGTYAKIDVGEWKLGNGGADGRFNVSAGLLPMDECREIVEGLKIKYGVTV